MRAPPEELLARQGSLESDIASDFSEAPIVYDKHVEVPDFRGQIKVTRWHQTSPRESVDLGGKISVEFPALRMSLRGMDLVIHKNSHCRVNMARRTCQGHDGLYVAYVGGFHSRAVREAFSDAALDDLYANFPETQDIITALLPKRFPA